MKWQLRTQLNALHRRFGHTMIYVTHDQTEALTFADKVVVMYEGEVVQIGTPEELFDEPAHTFVGYFIGSPGMNVLPCAVQGDRMMLGGREVALGRSYPRLGGVTEAGIRPEFVRLAPAGQGLPLTVTGVEDIGRFKIVRALLDGRSEEHTSELQSLMRISYAVFCLKKKNKNANTTSIYYHKIDTKT